MALTPTEEVQTRTLLAQQAQILSLAGSEPAIMSSLGATDVNLSQLPAASSVSDADLLLIRQGSTDKSVAGSIVKSYATTTVNHASETVKGIVELATAGETQSGADNYRAVHPAGLASLTSTETRAGLIELATNAEVQAGIDTVRAVTPAGRRADKATSASDPTYADNSTKSASTQWVRNAMLAIATASGFAASLTANGYVKFPSWLGGLIFQWGSFGSINDVATTVITFPVAFPLACVFATATRAEAGGGDPDSFSVNARGTANMTLQYQDSGADASAANLWFAIGY
jgi:hypothetical protein